MLEPRAIGQAFGVRQLALALDQQAVDLCHRRRSQSRSAIGVSLFEGFMVFGGATRHLLGGILDWREIQMRRNSLHLGSNKRLSRIVASLEHSFLNLAIALANLIVCFLRERLQFLHVSLHRVRKISELEWQQVRIGEAHHRGAAGLR